MKQKNRHISKKLDIIALCTGRDTSSISGREIARRLSLSPQTALTSLNQLVQQGILRSTRKGRNREYLLNLDSLAARLMVLLMEHWRALNALHNAELRVVLEDLLPHAEAIIVFGSFAKGTEKSGSDVDLLVIGRADAGRMRAIARGYPRTVNMEFVSRREWEKSMREQRPLAIEVAESHLLFGDIDGVVGTLIGSWRGAA